MHYYSKYKKPYSSPGEHSDRHKIEPRQEKTVFWVSDQVRHKPGCMDTEGGERLEISDVRSRGFVLYTVSTKRNSNF